ncbi:MAG TPA: hypothetical protein VMJ10_00645 [Kofleriaceae bacterium]|nr:hypothetical protein [Kofleriaceae bacterium]
MRRLAVLALAACTHAAHAPTTPVRPEPALAVGACGDPGRDGVMSSSPRLDHADRDLDGDGRPEAIVVDRALCTSEGNCYWNVFARGGSCARYVGTFEGAALEALPSRGDEGMADVRTYWNDHGGRLHLQTYRFIRGAYRIDDVLQCMHVAGDRLECAEADR